MNFFKAGKKKSGIISFEEEEPVKSSEQKKKTSDFPKNAPVPRLSFETSESQVTIIHTLTYLSKADKNQVLPFKKFCKCFLLSSSFLASIANLDLASKTQEDLALAQSQTHHYSEYNLEQIRSIKI